MGKSLDQKMHESADAIKARVLMPFLEHRVNDVIFVDPGAVDSLIQSGHIDTSVESIDYAKSLKV